LKKLLEFKEILIVFGIAIAALVNLALFVEGRYATAGQVEDLKESHQRLEQRVLGNELDQSQQKALDNYFFYRQLERKYPHDTQVTDGAKKATERVKKIERQIKELEKVRSKAGAGSD